MTHLDILHLTAPGYTLAHLDPHQQPPGLRHLDGDVCGPSYPLLFVGATVAYLADHDCWSAEWDSAADPTQCTALISLGQRVTYSFPRCSADNLTPDEADRWSAALVRGSSLSL